MKVLITGALGQDGQILSSLLRANGHTVIKLPKFTGDPAKKLILDYSKTKEFLTLERPNKIVHLASIHGPSGTMDKNWSLDQIVFDVGVMALRNIIDAVSEVDSSIQIVAASSSRVFTPTSTHDYRNEKSEMNPSDFYGKVKMEMRKDIAKARNAGLIASTVILFNHYSIYSKSGYLGDVLASKIVDAIRSSNHKITLNNPFAIADLSHAIDICNAMYKILESGQNSDFVLGSGKPTSMNDIINQISNLMGVNLSLEVNPQTNKDSAHFVIADTTKARSLGLLNPMSSYAEAVMEKIYQLLN